MTARTLRAGRLWYLQRLRLGPSDIEQPVGHRIVKRQFAHDFADFFVNLLIELLGLSRGHALLHFVKEAQAQVFGRRPAWISLSG